MIRLFVVMLSLATLIAQADDLTTTNRPAQATNARPNQCAEFSLSDQFDQRHTFKFPRLKPIVLAVADKRGADEIESWTHPLAERFGDRIDLPGLADVSAVPRPLRGFVQGKFKKAIKHPVMLDWDGKVASGFHYTKGQANVYLIAPDGRVLHHLAGPADAAKLRDVGERIDALLSPAASPQANARSN